MENEIWKNIQEFDWYYQASNMWKIASLRFEKFKILWLSSNKKWYLHISIHWNNRKNRLTKSVHILVYKAFKWDIPKWFQINHINWIKDDNRIDNLEAISASDNLKHSYKFLWRKSPNKWKFWSKNKLSKKVIQSSLEWVFIKEWEAIADITRELWYKGTCISACCNWSKKRMYWFIWKFKVFDTLLN